MKRKIATKKYWRINGGSDYLTHWKYTRTVDNPKSYFILIFMTITPNK